MPSIYYECDQIDGLMNCLESIIGSYKISKLNECDQLDGLMNCLTSIIDGTSKLNESLEDVGFSEIDRSKPRSSQLKPDKQIYFPREVIHKLRDWSLKCPPSMDITIDTTYAFKITINTKRKVITIVSYEDEWFLLADNATKFYECDQFDGLINCLEMVLISDRSDANEFELFSKRPGNKS